MGVFRDKDYERIAQIMGPVMDEIRPVDLPDRNRGLPSGELARTLEKYCPCVRDAGQGSVESAVEAVLADAGETDVILAFGSLSYLHEVKAAYDRIREADEKRV